MSPPDTLLSLKSGEQVRGKLVEVKSGAYVLTLPDGRTVLYPTDDVATAERLTGEPDSRPVTGVALLAPGGRAYVRDGRVEGRRGGVQEGPAVSVPFG